jgi:hypothetical protein
MRGNDARQRCRVWPEQQPLQGQGRGDAVGQGRRFMLEAEQQEGLLGGAVAGALGGRGLSSRKSTAAPAVDGLSPRCSSSSCAAPTILYLTRREGCDTTPSCCRRAPDRMLSCFRGTFGRRSCVPLHERSEQRQRAGNGGL